MNNIKFLIDRSLEEGYPFSYILNEYVPSKVWSDLINIQLDYGILRNSTDYNYARCFSFLILEEINLPNSLYSKETGLFIRERGFLEMINLQISAIAPCAILEKRSYVSVSGQKGLAYPIIEVFKNPKLETSYVDLVSLLKEKEITILSREELRIPLSGVKVENIEDEDVTYLNYLFE